MLWRAAWGAWWIALSVMLASCTERNPHDDPCYDPCADHDLPLHCHWSDFACHFTRSDLTTPPDMTFVWPEEDAQ